MRKFRTVGTLAAAFALSFGCGIALNAQVKAEEKTVTAKENLVAHYEFADAANLGKDTSGNGNHLVVNNASQVSQGKYGVNLAGTETNGGNMGMLYAPYKEGSTKDFTDDISGEYTVSFWTVISSSNVGYIVQNSCWENGFSVAYSGGNIFTACGAGETKINYEAPTNVWNYVTVSASTMEGKAYYYLNGALKSTQNMVGKKFTLDVDLFSFTLGGQCNPKDNWFANGMTGSFADFRIYNKALSATEVTSAMNEAGITAGMDGSNIKPIEGQEMIAHYEFKDAANVGKDSSENGFDLAYAAGSEPITVLPGGVAQFSTKQLLYAPTDFSDTVTDYTVSLWIKANFDDNAGYILSTGGYESQFHLSAAYGNAFVHFGTKSDSNVTVGVAGLIANEWNHVIMSGSVKNGTVEMYINGTSVLSKTGLQESDVKMGDSVWAFSVGGQADENGASATPVYNGFMKDLRVYNYQLTATEVTALYQAPTVTFMNGETLVDETFYTGEAVVAPTAPNATAGEVFVGWLSNGKLYPAGYQVEATVDMTFSAYYVDFGMKDGASIRMEAPNGIRFRAEFLKEDYDALVGIVGADNVKLGMRIVRGDNKYLDIVAANTKVAEVNGAEHVVFNGVVVNIAKENYNVTYCGTGYVEVTYANNETVRIYAAAGDNTRTVAEVAKAVYESDEVLTTEQKAMLENYFKTEA